MQVGSEVIRSYKRLAYDRWHALAEFVDNSTQSYLDNQDALDVAYTQDGASLGVRIVYDHETDLLRISDNAMGMDRDELKHALHIGLPPANTSGRSQYGLGMKTAACWFGDEWSITTKKLGESGEYRVTVDVEAVANGNLDLPVVSAEKDVGQHYTILEIRKMHSRIHGRTLGKIKQFLRSMFRVDIREERLTLCWQGEELGWSNEAGFQTARDGSVYRMDLDFELGGKKVKGWVGVLAHGHGGRSKAGFAMVRRGRVVRLDWRPEDIFGERRNDLINQRITGEIVLDDFGVSHTKDDILFQDNEQEEIGVKLKELCMDYLHVARTRRSWTNGEGGPSEAEVRVAVDELRTEMQSPEFVDAIETTEVPAPEAVTEADRPVLGSVERQEPDLQVSVGEHSVKVFVASDNSPNDPYYATEIGEEGVIVVVNQCHPHWRDIRGAEGVANFLRHCVYDAVAEWKCRRRQAPVQPGTIKQIKDVLLRLSFQIEQSSDAATTPSADPGSEGGAT